jgi:hypothetical protein
MSFNPAKPSWLSQNSGEEQLTIVSGVSLSLIGEGVRVFVCSRDLSPTEIIVRVRKIKLCCLSQTSTFNYYLKMFLAMQIPDGKILYVKMLEVF